MNRFSQWQFEEEDPNLEYGDAPVEERGQSVQGVANKRGQKVAHSEARLHVAGQLRHLLASTGHSPRSLAERAGVGKDMIYHAMNETKGISMGHLGKIASAAGHEMHIGFVPRNGGETVWHPTASAAVSHIRQTANSSIRGIGRNSLTGEKSLRNALSDAGNPTTDTMGHLGGATGHTFQIRFTPRSRDAR
jgi:DNA-binding phage protein